ncbi:hypothetical protein [Pedobacter sp. V48]|uniref:hypothetical protein n=1 Tax=Pedobacter sp. V48 TaxID=509635 RepID=UPI0003E5208B|nr:hypothetical protein [Pedobacter sp. V48]ETZ24512.1 hypothetical protein N824_13415 [Pedobacter sp. V48]
MKKSVIGIILYFLILHVLIPGVYYLFNGFVPIYTDLIDIPSLIKSAILIILPVCLSLIILYLLPKDQEIAPNIEGKPVTELFYFSVLFKMAVFYYFGGFASIINGEVNGTFSNYFSLFFNPFILLLVVLFVQKKRTNIILAVLFYVVSITLSGSRSGILAIFFVFMIGYSFQTFQGYKNKLYSFLKYSLLISPFLFIYATSIRGAADTIDKSVLLNQIVGRMSTLETSMMPLYFYHNNMDMELFYDKYGIWNQLKLILDGIIPGQIFDYDVMPNNYYRAIFMGYSKSFVVENYMSINLTLPIYLYLKYSYLSILFTILYVLGFYKIVLALKNYPLLVVVVLSVFYNVIYFFDWVMVFSQIYTALLTVLCLKMYVFFRKEVIVGLKRDLNEY